MDYLHSELDLTADDVVVVTLDHAANVQLLDAPSFQNYQAGRPYRYHGGHARESPVRLPSPGRGRWHLVVDLGGTAGVVRAGVKIESPAMAGR